MNDKPNTNNFYKALEVLKITDWKFEGTDPTNETEFKAGFKKLLVMMVAAVLFTQMTQVSLILHGHK